MPVGLQPWQPPVFDFVDASKALFRVADDNLETDSTIAKVTTKAGKVLEGVYVADRDMATAVDKFTWRPQGQTGYFARIKHVVRPNEKQEVAFSKASNERPQSEWLSVAPITQGVNDPLEQFKTTIPGQVVDRVSNIPGFADSAAVAAGATTNNRIYLIRGGLRGNEIDVTLFHEMLHFVVRRVLPQIQYATTMSHNPV